MTVNVLNEDGTTTVIDCEVLMGQLEDVSGKPVQSTELVFQKPAQPEPASE
jgi:hypothetical protein